MDQTSNAFLENEPIGKLMQKYAIPCTISLLVAALYNIVDQIFIANASYLGSYGNAANTVVFPLTVVALAIAVMIGDGCCAYVSICLGANRKEDAHKSIGSSILLCIVASLIVTAVYLIFQEPILTVFGGRVNEGTLKTPKNTSSGSPWASPSICSARLSTPSSALTAAQNSPWPPPWPEPFSISSLTPFSSSCSSGA